jgi:hypothetical protein
MRRVWGLITTLLLGGFALSVRAAEPETTLALLPAQITLHGAQATQRLLVEAQREGAFVGDLSGRATFASSAPGVVQVGKDGTLTALKDGRATITASVGGQKATATVNVVGTGKPFRWSFRNHVLPILTKTTCNSGACHGAAAGKGGLKLTLRGFDPDADFDVLTRQARGRRIVPGDPKNSLLLQKTTMQIGHGGGKRIDSKSRDYAVIAAWIQAGTPQPRPDDPRPLTLDVFPDHATLRPGDTQQIVVRARYSDGHTEDVTRWVKFGSSENSVATVDDNGKVKVNGPGEAAVTVWFSNRVTFARVVAPFCDEPRGTRGEVSFSFVDRLINRKLTTLGIPASPPATDNEFVRRAYLDTLGVLPKPEEVEAFVKGSRADKKATLVDALLTRPEFVDYWTYQWSDLLLVSSRKLPGNALTAFSNFIRKSVEENKPWNRFVREILTARGSNLDNGAANYFILHKDAQDLTETTTQAFLGLSLMCARCHNHPLEKWTMRDYYQMANLVSRVRLKNGDQGGETLVLASTDGNINHPRLGVPLPPRPLDGQEMPLDDLRDRREILADWITAPDNPYFAKALVNRVWKRFMGRGLVEAEDDLRLTNPPTNQELFDALAQDFVANGYDVKRLMRTVLLSEAYGRSATPVPGNEKDDRFYSRYIVRRLPAEVILDALSQVTNAPTAFEGYPKGFRALQLPDSQVASYFLTAFGRPDRAQTCSCERQQEPNIAQALHLANGDTVNMKLRAAGNAIDALLDRNADDEEALRSLYLSALSRPPTDAERAKTLAVMKEGAPPPNTPEADKKKSRRALLEDVFWAVLTDREFLFNH